MSAKLIQYGKSFSAETLVWGSGKPVNESFIAIIVDPLICKFDMYAHQPKDIGGFGF